MNSVKKTIGLFLLFSLPVFAINAQPQSFFISPGQVIEDGNIIRGYCLEYSKDMLNDNNIGDLKQITGNALVSFKDGTTRVMTFEDLYLIEKLIHISGYGSAQYVRMNLDSRVARVTVSGIEGIVLAREKMSPADSDLVKANVSLITDMLKNGASHQTAQNAAWLNKVPSYSFDRSTNTITIDYNTSPEGQRLIGRYGNTAAVIFDHSTGEFRFDGLKADTSTRTKVLYDFITHFHSDHIDYRALERILRDGLNSSVYFPLPMLDKSMRKNSFKTMQSIVDTGAYQFDIQNYVCEMLPEGVTSNIPVTNSIIGQFLYSQYRFGDLIVDTYRHINPKNENADGLIYRLRYRNISQLNLGDFDDEKALTDLLQLSEENQKKRLEMLEEYYALEEQTHSGNDSAEIKQRRSELLEQIQSLPIIMADVVKWPHHAHIFKNIGFVEQFNRIVNPSRIIYQTHHAQDEKEFEEFIWRTSFPEKFINSGKHRVEIISLEWLKIRGLS